MKVVNMVVAARRAGLSGSKTEDVLGFSCQVLSGIVARRENIH